MSMSFSHNNIPKTSQNSIELNSVSHLPDNNKSKNNEFFNISTTLYSMKPPPSIINTTTCNQDHIIIEQEDTLPNFTDRIQYIVLANKKPSVVAPEIKEEKTMIPLPIPIQRFLTPMDSSAIPIISLSPNFSPNKTNIIPSLSEVPMLGDTDDRDDTNFEYKFFMAPPVEDNLIGKYVWKYHIIRLLGEGAFSKVYLADNLEQGGKFAVKMIQKNRIKENKRLLASIEREVGVLKFLNHDSIVQLEATMETEQHLCIVLEYVQGEELFDFVQRMHTDIHKEASKASVDENLIKRLALELVQVVSWLHNHNIVHRDLKLENILIYHDKQGESHLKITDFGLARVFDPEYPILTTRCGSEEYAAPEIVQNIGYDGRLTDTWSIGIILYGLLVGYLPFSYSQKKGEKISSLYHRIILAKVIWPRTDNISIEAKQVVESILIRQPDKRIRLNQFATLPWFQQQ